MQLKNTPRPRYRAIVLGDPLHQADDSSPSGNNFQVNLPVDGKESLTVGKRLESLGRYTVVELKPITGRRHQLRQHMAALKCPIAALFQELG